MMFEEYCKYYKDDICNYQKEKGQDCIGSDCEVMEIICPHCKGIIKEQERFKEE